jgi:hypothetical protein
LEGRPSIRSYAMVLALAAALRILWAVLVPVAPLSDSAIYDGAAQRLAEGRPYTIDEASAAPSAHWPIGTSFMYSLVYRVFDPQTSGYTPVVILNLAISLAVVGLSMALASRWFGGRVGTVTGILLALWPMHIQFTTVIASEPIFTACILSGMWAWPPLRGRGDKAPEGYARLAIAGLCFAAATYTRPTSLLFPLILGGIEFLRSGRIVTPGIRAAITLVVLLVALSPWTYRNYRVFNKLVLVSTNGGTNMWMGNNPDTTGYYQPPPTPDAGQNEAVWDKELGNRAKAYIRDEPVAFVKRSIVKAVRLHDRETIGVAWNLDGLKSRSAFFDTGPGSKTLKALSSGYWYLMLVLGATGAVVLARREGLWRAITHPTVVFFAYFTAVHAIMVIQDRYHFPVTPMVAALAALTIGALLKRKDSADTGLPPP